MHLILNPVLQFNFYATFVDGWGSIIVLECHIFFAILIFESDSNHWLPPSPSTNSKAGPCRESWEIIEGNPLNLESAKKLILWKYLSYTLWPPVEEAPQCE